MSGANELSQRLDERFRTLARAHDDENAIATALSVGQVDRPLPLRLGKLRLFYRTDDADNGEQLCFLRFVAPKDLLAERAVGPITPGQILVDHADAFRAVRI